LGAKNCEFAPEHIAQITDLFLAMADEGISKVFENREFGFYKVTIERPLRLAAQFSAERVAGLRFVGSLREPMEWIYETWGDRVYGGLADVEKEIRAYVEREELALSAKQLKALCDPQQWRSQREVMIAAEKLAIALGDQVWFDFNRFSLAVDEALKGLGLKLSATEKKQILSAISWTDETAAKVVKKAHKLKGETLAQVLEFLGTTVDCLPDFGYFPSDRPGVWVEYESDSELRDTESIPLADQIHGYFLREVKPHVEDAWIDLSKTTIGYEISFNKYFYKHQPLRSLAEVTAEILQLEAETEGLLKNLVNFAGL
jgi:type I restriction enzyme M protein